MKMLVVVDYQKDFVDGSLGFPGAEALDAGIAAKIRQYAQAGDVIVQTMDTHHPDYLNTREGKHLPVLHCIEGSEGWETYGETAKALEEVGFMRIDKATFPVHPAQMMELLSWLEGEEITEIEFVGLVSNICVISNLCVFQGAFPMAQMLVDKNLIASFDPKTHAAVLEVMAGLQVKFL
ncbi:MAG: cysteine hydrolase [Oscillospiraceae bacterium]|nr:cysteine hydrolase [Oscillospiraceae bacterium]